MTSLGRNIQHTKVKRKAKEQILKKIQTNTGVKISTCDSTTFMQLNNQPPKLKSINFASLTGSKNVYFEKKSLDDILRNPKILTPKFNPFLSGNSATHIHQRNIQLTSTKK